MAAQSRKINGKVIIAGPAAVGKTCLIERFVNNVYAADDASHGPTLGCDCLQKTIFVDDTEVKLYLYDTAGQERFAEMAGAYYRIGEVCLLCFDMSNLASFDNTKWWMKKVMDYNATCTFILVGTKEDLVAGRSDLDISEISDWAKDKNIPFFQTSALKGGDHVNFLFHSVAEKCIRVNLERQLENRSDDKKNLSAFGHAKSTVGCCT
mmetsp:Transcript_37949/g.60112  ORF Transcript_37949/g.60112 Transcript_37949/m.60112 type:complete len:208 (-) Transcript_37949:71-694(-)